MSYEKIYVAYIVAIWLTCIRKVLLEIDPEKNDIFIHVT